MEITQVIGIAIGGGQDPRAINPSPHQQGHPTCLFDTYFIFVSPAHSPADWLANQPASCLAGVQVVEHLDPAPLAAVGAAILGALRPRLLVVSTPNREYNAVLLGLMGVSGEDAIGLAARSHQIGCRGRRF